MILSTAERSTKEQIKESSPISLFTINLSDVMELTNEKLALIFSNNSNLRFERTSLGELVVMSPAFSNTGRLNLIIAGKLFYWNKKTKLGVCFDSSAGFTLKNEAVRAPDASWIAIERWNALSIEEQEDFSPICPDFVVELMSKSDRLAIAQDKMKEWMENGCRLAWLIDPKNEKAYIYRGDGSHSMLDSFDEKLSGEDVLPNFELSLAELRIGFKF